MLLKELTTSDERRIAKINRALKESYGFSLNSDVDATKIQSLHTKVTNDLYNLKLNNATAKDAEYIEKLLIKEGLELIQESAMLSGPGGRAMERVVNVLSEFVRHACEVGDTYEEAIRDAMKHYRSSKYRFDDDHVEFEVRKLTQDCAPLDECGGMMYEDAKPDFLDIDKDGDKKESMKKAAKDKEEANEEIEEGEQVKIPNKMGYAPKAGSWKSRKHKAQPVEEEGVEEDAPEGWEGTVKAMKKHKDIDNPWALAHWMKNKGYKSHKKESIDEEGAGMERVLFSGYEDLMNKPQVRKMFANLDAQVNDNGDGIVEIIVDIEPERAEKISSYLEKLDRTGEYYGGYIHLGGEDLEEANLDRYAERDWVRGMMKDKARAEGNDELELSLAEPEDDDNNDYFSYQAKKTKRNEMKEGYVKQLRRLLEAEVEQAESLIAAKSFSQELQDMVEKLGRLVNEDLPAVSEQMRDAYGADVATSFEDSVGSTLSNVMDTLKSSKQELDNSVSTIADGGMPSATTDMDDFGAEGDLDTDVDDADLDTDVDLDLDTADLEGGDELGGMDAAAGPEGEELGRAKKESVRRLQKKIVEMQAKIARAKKRELSEKWGENNAVNPNKAGMFKGKSKEDLCKERDRLKKKEKRTKAESTRLRELNFAIRAKSNWGDVNCESTEVDEKWSGNNATNPKKKGMFKGKTEAELRKERAKLKKKEKRTKAESTRLREINFALRAKTGWGKVDKD